MTSKDFIIEQVDNLILRFPYLHVRYEFDIFSDSHYIEVLPYQSYKTDESYINQEQRIVSHFIKDYPFEAITFITKGDLYSIENPIYIKSGWVFDLKDISFKNNIEKVVLVENLSLESILATKIFPNSIRSMEYYFLNTNIKSESIIDLGKFNYSQSVEPNVAIAGNTEYAMAA